MSLSMKKSFYALIALPIIVSFSTVAMEKEVSPIPLKEQIIKPVDCSIMIPDNMDQVVTYASTPVHRAIFKKSGLNRQSTIKDPIIFMHIQQTNAAHNNCCIPLPAKLFVSCSDKSVLQLHATDGSKLFKNNPEFKEISLKITATCTKNENLKGNNFAQQFKNAMHQFYSNPGRPLVDKQHANELETAGILIPSNFTLPHLLSAPNGSTIRHLIVFRHGPNGYPHKPFFTQLTIDEQIPTTMYLPSEIEEMLMTPEEISELQERNKTFENNTKK